MSRRTLRLGAGMSVDKDVLEVVTGLTAMNLCHFADNGGIEVCFPGAHYIPKRMDVISKSQSIVVTDISASMFD